MTNDHPLLLPIWEWEKEWKMEKGTILANKNKKLANQVDTFSWKWVERYRDGDEQIGAAWAKQEFFKVLN